MSLFWPRREAPVVVRQNVLMPSVPITLAGTDYSNVAISSLESSLQAVAVHAAVDLIASLVSELPVDQFRRARSTGEPAQEMDPSPWILDPSADGYGVEDFLYKLLVSYMLRGNLFGQVGQRAAPANGSFPMQMDILHPDHVRGQMQDGAPVWYLDGQELPAIETFHRRQYPVPGVVSGLSVIAHHARTIGLNLTVNQFGLQFFTDGGMPGAVLTNADEELDDETKVRTIKARWRAATQGNREAAVLGRGWKYEPITINPEEGQFLQTYEMSAAECARLFGPGLDEILGYQSATKGGSLTYANLQSREAHLLVFTFGRWVRRAERVLNAMLPRTQYVKLNRNALLETTTLERYQAWALALGGQAFMNVDEVREKENLDTKVKVEQPKTAPKTPTPEPAGAAK